MYIINKETLAFTYTSGQMDLTGIYKTFHRTAAEYLLFLCLHGTFLRIYHVRGHKINLSKFKKIEIIPSIFSNHSGMKVEISTGGKWENSQICVN